MLSRTSPIWTFIFQPTV